jgi:hypothetical protein
MTNPVGKKFDGNAKMINFSRESGEGARISAGEAIFIWPDPRELSHLLRKRGAASKMNAARKQLRWYWKEGLMP